VQQFQRSPVDGAKPQADEPHADKVIQAELLAEDGGTEQNGADRNQESDERDIGGTRRGKQAEIENIGKRGAKQGEPQNAN
jgi:hypothetical protein